MASCLIKGLAGLAILLAVSIISIAGECSTRVAKNSGSPSGNGGGLIRLGAYTQLLTIIAAVVLCFREEHNNSKKGFILPCGCYSVNILFDIPLFILALHKKCILLALLLGLHLFSILLIFLCILGCSKRRKANLQRKNPILEQKEGKFEPFELEL